MSMPRASRAALAGTLLAALLAACGVISLEPLGVTVWPTGRDAIVAAGTSPWVQFPSPPDRPGAQRLFTLSSPTGQVSGDFRWDGLRMYFDAAPPLLPGVRYLLTFRGRVTLENGDAFDANEIATLYVSHGGPGPVLLSSDPADGATCGTQRPLVLRFSAPIDPNSFARQFNLQPSAETVVGWDLAGQVVTVAPRDAWSNLATCTWTVSRDLAAPDGTPTGIDYSGRFRVQEDSSAPLVLSIVPAIHDTLAPTGADLDHVGADDALLFTFSEDVRADTLSAALTVAPAAHGAVMRVSAGRFALVPDSRWVRQPYTLQIAATVEDLAGNRLASPYERTFTPGIPGQAVTSIKAVYAASEDEWTEFNTFEAKQVTVDATGSLSLVIRFSEPFAATSRPHLVSAMTFSGWFPSSVPDPSLVTVVWSDGSTLALTWTGLQKSETGIDHYYKFLVPGGSSSDNGSGSLLEEDVWLYFVARP
jgi:hypothetical protein